MSGHAARGRRTDRRAAERKTAGSAVTAAAEITPERQALAAVEALATRADCSCGHAFTAHLGAEGPCTDGDCSCDGYEAATEEAALEAAGLVLDRPHLVLVAEGDAEGDAETIVPLPAGYDPRRILSLRLGDFQVTVPAEHAPGEVLPARAPDAVVTDAPAAAARGPLAWTATLVLEGTLTDDGRCFAPGSITWRELPLTLMAMIETSGEGHNGAIVSGRIDRVWKDGLAVKASGVFDDGEFGMDIGRMVGEGTLRGVSVDVAVHSYETGDRGDFFDEDGNWLEQAPEQAADEGEPSILDIIFGTEQPIYVVTDGVIGAATVCPFPAFAGADISLAASLCAAGSPAVWTYTHQAGFVVTQRLKELAAAEVPPTDDEPIGEVLTAAAAGLAPLRPPADWFTDPQLAEMTPLTVTDDGRIFGHAWAWDVCHIGIPDACTTAPHSAVDNAYFHLGEIELDDGSRIACGKVTLDTGHADRQLGRSSAAAHYDDTGTVAAHVVCGEDEHGGWIAGALHSELSEDKARLLRGAVLSGDWRNVNGNLELVALLAVNVPGFPVPRARALVAAGEDGDRRMTLVAAGINIGSTDEELLAKVTALADGARTRAEFDRLAARARVAAGA